MSAGGITDQLAKGGISGGRGGEASVDRREAGAQMSVGRRREAKAKKKKCSAVQCGAVQCRGNGMRDGKAAGRADSSSVSPTTTAPLIARYRLGGG